MVKLRSIDDLTDLEKLSLINMSYSRLSTYDMCPSKYFYTYIQKEERVFGPPATLGNIIHEVLEDHVGEKLTAEVLVDKMNEITPKYDPDSLISKSLLNSGKEMLIEFADRHADDEELDIVGKELPFEIVVGNTLIRGYIDLVLRDADGSYHIVDYKSGKNEVAYKNAPKDLQLGTYALAIQQIFGDDKPIRAELYYLRSGHRKGHTFTKQDIEDVHDRLLKKINQIREDQNFKATDVYRFCSFCDFQKNKVCKVGAYRMKNF